MITTPPVSGEPGQAPMLINDRNVRVLNLAGQLLGDYTINPNHNYQARNKT